MHGAGIDHKTLFGSPTRSTDVALVRSSQAKGSSDFTRLRTWLFFASPNWLHSRAECSGANWGLGLIQDAVLYRVI